MTVRIFTPDQDRLLAIEYMKGKTYRELAEEYGGTDISVRRAVQRGGGVSRGNHPRPQWSIGCKSEALRLYLSGMSVRALAKRYSTRTDVISATLADAGVELHLGGRSHPRLRTRQQCQDVADAYESGKSLAELAEQRECSTPAVIKAIKRVGGTIRPPGRSKLWTPAVITWTVEQYKAGRSQQSIADELGVNQASISAQLRRANVFPEKPRASGADHGSWKGGRSVNGQGYVSLLVTDDDLPYCKPDANGRVPEHRLVMGRALGRPLTSKEQVHHINADKTDNRIENLQLRQGAHGSGIVMTCNACGSHDVRAVPIGN